MKTVKTLGALVLTALAVVSCSQKSTITRMELSNNLDSVSYALGYLEAGQVKTQMAQMPFEIDSASFIEIAKVLVNTKVQDKYWEFRKNQFDTLSQAAFVNGFLNELASNKSHFDQTSSDLVLRAAYDAAQEKKNSGPGSVGAINLEKGKKFLAENGARAGVITTASGLQYEILRKGTGPIATTSNQVKCHYQGSLIDGKVFDSSIERGEPVTFAVTGVIKGWTEALQLMPQGSKWRLYIPAALAYGSNGAGGDIGPNETLIFDLDLLEVQ